MRTGKAGPRFGNLARWRTCTGQQANSPVQAQLRQGLHPSAQAVKGIVPVGSQVTSAIGVRADTTTRRIPAFIHFADDLLHCRGYVPSCSLPNRQLVKPDRKRSGRPCQDSNRPMERELIRRLWQALKFGNNLSTLSAENRAKP
jgi:hypothetical protein